MLEDDYKYTGKDGVCRQENKTGIKTKRFGFNTYVPQNDANEMKAAVEKGVVSVAIQADQRVFQLYKNGIFDSTRCGTQLDHATNVVGYGEEAGQEYWIMRNSWGNTWGEKGYMRLAIVEGAGICGI